MSADHAASDGLQALRAHLRALELRAISRMSAADPRRAYSRREAAKIAVKKLDRSGGQRISAWVHLNGNPGQTPSVFDELWKVIETWSTWAGERPVKDDWEKLFKAAQATPVRRGLPRNMHDVVGDH